MGSSRTRAWTRVPCIGRRILNHWATREVPRMRLFWAGPGGARAASLLTEMATAQKVGHRGRGCPRILSHDPPGTSHPRISLSQDCGYRKNHTVVRNTWGPHALSFPVHLGPAWYQLERRSSGVRGSKWTTRGVAWFYSCATDPFGVFFLCVFQLLRQSLCLATE